MTPKEKAKELVDKYTQYVTEINEYEYAKNCALIAVDEIIKANPYEVSKTDIDSTIDYWQEVKQEIEKL